MNEINRYLADVQHLPPAPTLVVELLEQFKQSDRDIDRVVELISHDPSLTAEVLKLCNSAYLSGAQPVEGMFEAVTRIGFYEVYCSVVAAFGARTMALPGAGRGVDVTALWKHSVVAAVAAKEIARHIQADEAVAFTSGLLHDVGRLILASKEGDKYAKLTEEFGKFGPPLLEAERILLKLDHAKVGGHLMARWNLPASVVEATSQHHEPTEAGEFQSLAAMVSLADLISHVVNNNLDLKNLESQGGKESMDILKLSPDGDLPEMVELTKAGLERVKGLLAT